MDTWRSDPEIRDHRRGGWGRASGECSSCSVERRFVLDAATVFFSVFVTSYCFQVGISISHHGPWGHCTQFYLSLGHFEMARLASSREHTKDLEDFG